MKIIFGWSLKFQSRKYLCARYINNSLYNDFSEEEISGSEGKNALSEKLLKEMNAKLESLKEFPGIEGVYFTSFVEQ